MKSLGPMSIHSVMHHYKHQRTISFQTQAELLTSSLMANQDGRDEMSWYQRATFGFLSMISVPVNASIAAYGRWKRSARVISWWHTSSTSGWNEFLKKSTHVASQISLLAQNLVVNFKLLIQSGDELIKMGPIGDFSMQTEVVSAHIIQCRRRTLQTLTA